MASRLVTELAPRLRPDTPVDECVGTEFLNTPADESFGPRSIGFLGELSRRIMADPASRDRPEFMALGYWLRRANVERILAARPATPDDVVRVPRGVVLHIAPANVDTVFLYSFAVSLLAGNLNVVRVSQRLAGSLDLILGHLRGVLGNAEWNDVATRNRFLTYGHDDEVNRYLSSVADVRVMWGGDATITSLRALPAPPHVRDIPFPDRFSYCAVQSEQYLEADASTRQRLAEQFFNDAYWFDQLACSSPRIVYFVGAEESCRSASVRFWEQLAAVLDAKGWDPAPAVQMNHLVFACRELAAGKAVACGPLASRQPKHILAMEAGYRPPECGGGLFVEKHLVRLCDLEPLVRPADQTLTYFGFSREELKAFAGRLNGKGLSRMVPIGQALAFHYQWDGNDLLDDLTKVVHVQF